MREIVVANKTQATDAKVDDYIAAKATPAQADDCRALVALLQRVTGEQATMWGPGIVGAGRYRYTYESGRSGEAPLIGFAVRGREFVVYLLSEDAAAAPLLAKLGKHRIGKACLYFKRLEDLDVGVLEALARASVAEVERQHQRVRG